VQEVTKTSPATATALVHKRQIVISIADRKLAVMEDGHVLKTYPIAVGKQHTPSPDGDFVIINRAKTRPIATATRRLLQEKTIHWAHAGWG
jgi:lipoprotein-anchoring transpeptidase ErfK/SrfK